MEDLDISSQSLDDEQTTEKDSIVSVQFDSVLRSMGFSIKYQVVQLYMLFTFSVPFLFALCNYFFTGYEPPHVCSETNETELLSKYYLLNDTTANIVYERCQIRITSNISGHPEDLASTWCISGHSYEGGKGMTMKTEWDLVCERTGTGELIQTMLGVGMSIGTAITSSLPDRYGRKRVATVLCVITVAIEIGISFSPSVYVIIALKFLSGTVMQGVGPAMYLSCMEFVVTKRRDRIVFALCIEWSLCMMVLGFVSYALSTYSWRVLQLVTALFGTIPLMLVYFMDESLPWLFAKSRHGQALKIIKKACVNIGSNFEATKHEYDKCVLRLDKIQENKNTDTRKSTVSQYGFLDILFNRKLLITTLLLGSSFFTHNVAYYGLYLTSATFSVNHYFIIIIMAGLEIPSTVAFYVIIVNTKTRRSSVLFFLPITAVCLLVSACLVSVDTSTSDHVRNASVAFFIIGKFALNISYLSATFFVVEHYPTTLRYKGLAVCNFIGRVGVMLSPFLYPLSLIVSWAPNTILAVLCFVTAGFHVMVPETKDKQMPSNIIEAVDILPGSISSKRHPK